MKLILKIVFESLPPCEPLFTQFTQYDQVDQVRFGKERTRIFFIAIQVYQTH